MTKYIYYGAGKYAQEHFEDFRKKYEPLCFCDRSAENVDGGQMLFDLPVYPLSAMLERFPEAPIVVTVDPLVSKRIVQQYLIDELDISKDRIINYEIYEYGPSCWFLDNHVVLRKSKMLLCCSPGEANPSPVTFINENDTASQHVKKLIDLRNRIKKQISEGMPCECTGCPNLEQTWFRANHKVEMILLLFASPCNLRCIYCAQEGSLQTLEDFDGIHISNIVKSMMEENLVYFGTLINFATGEITVHPKRREILSSFNGIRTQICTNGVVYDDVLVEHLKLGKSIINCSIDAGTRETYKKIKGADKFEIVCENLKRYSQFVKIDLKYLFMDGENDDDNNIDGFIRFSLELKPRFVLLGRNHKNMCSLSNHALRQMAKVTFELNKFGINNRLENEQFHVEEKERLKNFISERMGDRYAL